MSAVRELALVDAPVPTVWELIGNPVRYPEWFPRVLEIDGERYEEGGRFVMVTRHPLSDRKMLWLNPVYVVKVDGLANSESAMLLRHLFQHCTRPDFVYRHLWEEGDIIIWDNPSVLHAATYTNPAQPRTLYRLTIKGPEPC